MALTVGTAGHIDHGDSWKLVAGSTRIELILFTIAAERG
jgi:hypothetical protein